MQEDNIGAENDNFNLVINDKNLYSMIWWLTQVLYFYKRNNLQNYFLLMAGARHHGQDIMGDIIEIYIF